MGDCLLTFSLRFYASHRLASPYLDEQKNREIYGKCANPGGHGHDYVVSITLKGRPAPESGLLIPRRPMFRIARRCLAPIMEYRNLNHELGENFITSGENLVQLIWDRLKNRFAPCNLHRVRLQETPKNFFTYHGP